MDGAGNIVELDTFAFTETRMVLSEREFFNSMTPGEYAIAFLWWTRAMGDNLVRTYFPPSSYRRFEEHAEDGFYNDSHARFSRLVALEMRNPGVTSR